MNYSLHSCESIQVSISALSRQMSMAYVQMCYPSNMSKRYLLAHVQTSICHYRWTNEDTSQTKSTSPNMHPSDQHWPTCSTTNACLRSLYTELTEFSYNKSTYLARTSLGYSLHWCWEWHGRAQRRYWQLVGQILAPKLSAPGSFAQFTALIPCRCKIVAKIYRSLVTSRIMLRSDVLQRLMT